MTELENLERLLNIIDDYLNLVIRSGEQDMQPYIQTHLLNIEAILLMAQRELDIIKAKVG